MKNRIVIALLIIFSHPVLKAQNFKYRYRLDTVVKTGWYQIPLAPEIRSEALPNLSDLRIMGSSDSSNRHEIPYYIKPAELTKSSITFQSFKWQRIGRSLPAVYELNTGTEPVSQITVKVSNHKNPQSFKLTGSTDRKEWFAISEQEDLVPETGNNQTWYQQSITFAKVPYTHFRIAFLDSNVEALNILDMGQYKSNTLNRSLNTLNGIHYSVTNDGISKKSIIRFYSEGPQWIDQLVFKVTEPAFFKRNARIFIRYEEKGKKGKPVSIEQNITNISLVSEETLNFPLAFLLKDTIFMEVENEDNPPLKWAEITFLQNPFSLYTYLKAGEEVSVFLGDHKLSQPVYDIADFARQKSENLPELQVICVEKLSQETQMEEHSVFESISFMWICIAAGGVVLVFFSIKLLKENKNAA